MIKFSLAKLQQNSPYELFYSDGDFSFVTDNGLHYSVSFSEESSLGNCDTYQLIIRRIDKDYNGYDSKVEKTILSIVNEFFRSNLYVLLYICDTSDHREGVRNRLFLNWFDRNAEPGAFVIRTANAKVENEEIYAAIIVDRRNPKLNDVLTEFAAMADVLSADK
mgnify:FL=1